eukprot:3746950-Alexandrium_andersonii.AAC.1
MPGIAVKLPGIRPPGVLRCVSKRATHPTVQGKRPPLSREAGIAVEREGPPLPQRLLFTGTVPRCA